MPPDEETYSIYIPGISGAGKGFNTENAKKGRENQKRASHWNSAFVGMPSIC
jgi:hypothetical protein